ncbi:ABC transporter substrate-binding protein [Actibacterium sp.]|uniref:ABC transporter substrate-binding protein n=1 Tax=Actibacterium sp. TaxID=1872125 RepID=UPI00257EE053|nr:ABC transporter substrate-binding protein [Actibacterium sp.]
MVGHPPFRRARAVLRAVLCAVVGAATAAGAAPERVVSLNLCTDQLAMLLAAPGQLVSVSFLAQDPMNSAMADAARAFPANRGQAEEVFLMKPDLVLAGTYTSRAAVSMLRRLGIEVVEFPPERSLDDVRRHLRLMGQVLGQQARAEAMIADYDTRLAALRADPAHRPRAALYSANGYTTGGNTLSGEILAAAGFDNIAAEAGMPAGGALPLEVLVMLRPDLVITGARYPGASRSEALLDHPALAPLLAAVPDAPATNADWVCGTPYVLRAIEGLVAARKALEAGQ